MPGGQYTYIKASYHVYIVKEKQYRPYHTLGMGMSACHEAFWVMQHTHQCQGQRLVRQHW